MAGGGVTTPTDKLEWVQFTAEEVKAIVTVAGNAEMRVRRELRYSEVYKSWH